MSSLLGIGTLSDTVGELRLQMPDPAQYDIIVRITGTWVGTIQTQRSADNKAFSAITPRNINTGTSADATANGTFAARCTAADKAARVKFSAFTSGSARVEATLLPV